MRSLKCLRRKARVLVHSPKKFSPHYPKYLGWSFVGNTLMSIESVVGSHSMLSVMGKQETDIAISYNYIGKDLLGQLGGLWYIYEMGKKADSEPSKLLKNSMYKQQFATMVECATPIVGGSAFLALATLATIQKSIAFTGLGAVNAKAIQKMGGENLGEMYSKVTTINTVASSLGMLIGLGICAKIPDHEERFAVVIPITLARTHAYKKSMEGLNLGKNE